MDALALIGERRIDEAVERGDWKSLACAGQPLPEDDAPAGLMPDERMAWRLLRTIGAARPLDDMRRLLAGGPGGVAESDQRAWLPQVLARPDTAPSAAARYARALWLLHRLRG
ncbi:DnaJ family domain-containing protein [Gulbenkiania mobilis]|uniref:Uncharacterized protein DUF1992 n=1 Tax=Gulbenkiania mobilis TaxID=397457 RepID=A0ABY2D1P2_GULMO|nr:uncharacterized protein DUF1992 [Gulbenkiania mobilis]